MMLSPINKVIQVSICFTLLFLFTGIVHAGDMLVVGPFSESTENQGALPGNWEPLTFGKIERHTRYSLIREQGTMVVKAESNASASGLIRKISIDPKAYPVIQWRWKISNVYAKGDVSKKSGDDYPARIYIAFAYDPDRVGLFEKAKFAAVKAIYGEYPPISAINYIWGSHAPVGTRVPNPFVDRVKMIVVESGPARANTWISEERNIYEDYKALFSEEPPMISGVAIMTDSDNTGESAEAYFGDIVFRLMPAN